MCIETSRTGRTSSLPLGNPIFSPKPYRVSQQSNNGQQQLKQASTTPAKPTFKSDIVEPRILMSATWVDANTLQPEASATDDADLASGTAADDILAGLGGDDQLFGADGNDSLFGNDGNDLLSGDGGDDSLDGAKGNDQLLGGTGNDLLVGGSGNDLLVGGTGDDTLRGDSQKNYIVNGSFENFSGGPIADGGWRGFQTLEGWKLESGPQFEVVDDQHGNVGSTDGEHWLDTDASPGDIQFSQKVEGLENGQSYELSFDARSRGAAGTGVLEVYWNGDKVGTVGGTFADGWQHQSFKLVAGSGDGTNTLRFAEVGRADNIGTALDNIRLVGLAAGNDRLEGGEGNDSLVGDAGDDLLIGGLGDDLIDGGEGNDTAQFSGSITDYEIVRLKDGSIRLIDLTGRGDGADLAKDVENFVFADAQYALEDLPVTQKLNAIYDTRYSGVGGQIWGDPHFVGDDGEKFDVQGDVGKIYNLVSDRDLQINSKFIAWGNGGATVMGQVGILAGTDQIEVVPGKAPLVNGVAVAVGTPVTVNGTTVSYDGRNTVVTTAEYKTTWISQGNYLDARLEATNPFADKVAPHGLWGLTVDGDKAQKNGDDIWNTGSFQKSQGGGAIDTVTNNGQVVQTSRGDVTAYKLYETTGIFSTKTTLADGAKFIRYGADAGTGLTQIGRETDGTNGNDILRGTQQNDVLRGLAGNDVLEGLAGDDRMAGGAGNDLLDGDVGNDVIVGDAGESDASNLIGDGSFANTGVTSGFQTRSVGQTFSTWTVERGTVDVIANYWDNNGGTGSVDLDGNSPGAISQTIKTVPGKTYTIYFDLAGNGDGGLSTKAMELQAGNESAQFTWNKPAGWSRQNMGYERHELTFTATSDSTKISFGSLTAPRETTGPFFGPVIANVKLTETVTAGNDTLRGGLGDDTLYGDNGVDTTIDNKDYVRVGDNLIVNGSFENNQTAHRTWSVFNSVEGWKATGGAGIEIQEEVAGTASSGTSLVELDSHNNSAMTQNVPTVAGEKYELSVRYSPRPGVDIASNDVEVYWNGTKLATMKADGIGNGNTVWRTFKFQVDGSGPNGQLEFRAAGRSDGLGGYIDDVKMFKLAAAIPVGGNDVLSGGEGNDRMFGQNGNDLFLGDAGADLLDGGAGTDTVDYSKSKEGVTVLLEDVDKWGPHAHKKAGGTGGDAQGDQYVSIENVVASANNDYVYGVSSGSSVQLGDGNDIFDNNELGKGIDFVDGGSGNDTIWTGDGSDTLVGGAGDDRILGEAGDDSLIGGLGNDSINGGLGSDTARFSGSINNYEITKLDDGSYRVVDKRPDGDGTDIVRNVESFVFSDSSYDLQSLPIVNRITDLGGEVGGQPVTFRITADNYDPANKDNDVAGAPKYQIVINGKTFVDANGNSTFTVNASRNRVEADGVDRNGDGNADKVQARDVNDYEFVTIRVPAGVDVKTAQIKFINDAWDGTGDNDKDGVYFEDRNLVVDHVNIGGKLNSDGTYEGGKLFQAEDGQYALRRVQGGDVIGAAETMYWQGETAFFTDGVKISDPVVDSFSRTIGTGNESLAIAGNASAYNRVELIEDGKVVATTVSDLQGQWKLNSKVEGSFGESVLLRVTNVRGETREVSLATNMGNDLLVGTDKNDKLDGGAGNDTIIGGRGDDLILGGSGDDVAVFEGNRRDYEITRTADGIRVHDLNRGQSTDIVKDVETFRFADTDVSGEFVGNDAIRNARGQFLIGEDQELVVRAHDLLPAGAKFVNVSTVEGDVVLSKQGEITFSPNANASGVARFSYTYQDTSGIVHTKTAEVQVQGIADEAVFERGALAEQTADDSIAFDGAEDAAVPINLRINTPDQDGSESLTIRINGVPENASLSHGTKLPDGTWEVDSAYMSRLKLIPERTPPARSN